MYGYPDLKNGGGSPFYNLEAKQDGKWQPQMMGWCGTGASNFVLMPGTTQAFYAYTGNVNGGEIRVTLNYKDAAGKQQTLKSNAIDLGDPKLAWLTLRPNGDCLLKIAEKNIIINNCPDKNGVVSVPTYSLQQQKSENWEQVYKNLCGTGPKNRTLNAHETISFKIRSTSLFKHKMRVVVECVDANGKRHEIISNTIN